MTSQRPTEPAAPPPGAAERSGCSPAQPGAPHELDPVAMFQAKALVKAGLFGARSDREDLASPTVGRYPLLQQIGAGGFGTVFRARDPKLGREVAIKLIPLDPHAPGVDPETFEEARAMARLQHPALVVVHDVGTCDASDLLGPRAVRCLFIVMELLGGHSLRQWLDAAPRSAAELVAVHVRAGEGAAAAHAHGVVHRDLKPSNIHVEDDRVCVLDFGLASMVEEDQMSSAHGPLDTSWRFGTPPLHGPRAAHGPQFGPGRGSVLARGLPLRVALRPPPLHRP